MLQRGEGHATCERYCAVLHPPARAQTAGPRRGREQAARAALPSCARPHPSGAAALPLLRRKGPERSPCAGTRLLRHLDRAASRSAPSAPPQTAKKRGHSGCSSGGPNAESESSGPSSSAAKPTASAAHSKELPLAVRKKVLTLLNMPRELTAAAAINCTPPRGAAQLKRRGARQGARLRAEARGGARGEGAVCGDGDGRRRRGRRERVSWAAARA